jgi:hypothetical protein
LLDRYTNIIRGIFSGHTHEDSFEIIKSRTGDPIPSAIINVIPTIGTYFLNVGYILRRFHEENPAFSIFDMDKSTHTLLDYEVRRLYIKEANEIDRPIWRKVYRFTEMFQVPNMNYEHYPAILNKMKTNPTLFEKMVNQLWGEGPRGADLLKNRGSINNVVKRNSCYEIYAVSLWK